MRKIGTILFAILSLYSAAFAGITVSDIRIEGLYSIKESELLYLLDIERGETIEPDALRRGVKRAFVKGIFESIEVDIEDSGETIIKVKEKDVIGRIEIKGNDEISGKFVKRHIGFKEGERFYPGMLDASVSGLKRAVMDRGFPDAEIAAGVKQTGRPDRVDIVISIKEGKPLIVREIVVLGPKEARGLIRLKEGDIYDQLVLREDVQRLSRHYAKRGHLNPVIGPYTYKDGKLFFSVNPGKKLSVEIKGNKALSGKKLRSALPFLEAADVREDLVEEAVLNMSSLYYSSGYPEVQIAPVVSEKGGSVSVHFYILEGRRVKVESIVFTGISIPEKNIKAIMFLREGDVYNPEVVETDMLNIKDFYVALGYLDASVGEPEVEISDAAARVRININEGAQVLLSGVAVEGIKSFPEKEIIDEMNLPVGMPYNEVDVMDARLRILSYYRGKGHVRAGVEVFRRFENGNAYVRFVVSEGGVFHFGKTVILGNARTKREAISRELLIERGAPFDNALLMKSRQRLYRLNLFTDVEIRNAAVYDSTIDVAVKVKEGGAGTVETGIGYGEYELYRGFVDVSYRNLFGMNRQVSLRTELSSIQQRYMLTYHEPWFLHRHIPMRVLLMREDRKEKNIDTGDVRYKLKRYMVSTGVQKMLGERSRFDLFYEFSLTETYDVMPDVVLSREDTGTLAISSIVPALAYDSRDNPFDPTSGVFAGLSMKVATRALFSESDFIKLSVHGSAYARPLKRLTTAVSFKAGAARGMHETTDLPLVERFFLGGRNTLRGFDQDTVGPVSYIGTPIGGSVFLLGNIELRLHLTKGLRLVGFFDSGNVWPGMEDMEPADLRYASGAGLRYNTPVGPLRLDYGWKLDRQPGETAGELHFSIGHAF